LPSALDNRPLNFGEFMDVTNQLVYVSATPGEFDINNSIVGNAGWIPNPENKFGEGGRAAARGKILSGAACLDIATPGAPLVVEQIIRPTGLLDPVITVRPLKAKIDETLELSRRRIESGERVLITTLTKKTAEDLADYLRDLGLKVRYLHSDIDTIERVEILRTLRAGDCDVLVGINLLREGLDLPEVSLVCILDADKEGYLRSRTSLVQTSGRAARHIHGEVVLFADRVTGSMSALLEISNDRRTRQEAYNKQHGITPRSVVRPVQESLHMTIKGSEEGAGLLQEAGGTFDAAELIAELERDMVEASARLEYERAALLRDQIAELKNGASPGSAITLRKKAPYPKPSRKKRG
jgi:excinuclease ABC subunit B